MRISDWSSDVCSSDLPGAGRRVAVGPGNARSQAGKTAPRHAREQFFYTIVFTRPEPFDDPELRAAPGGVPGRGSRVYATVGVRVMRHAHATSPRLASSSVA